ncbi:stage II sporulation protein D [Oceanirhabdus sp. W0125-5]|uniref:stage II sporulation protein D n=1 Tax=Oceanirhabdus sp. W0125-5 TaxID=2999116 RepID=UPI0022F31BDD|nr:stage II sporulation protein D [Oceanirhabdus sp. W0125-5]WBW98498.1 stage II sporulation protein D [Oceanirhabdus sp. W0125-5]
MNKNNYKVNFFDIIIGVLSIVLFLFVTTLLVNIGTGKGVNMVDESELIKEKGNKYNISEREKTEVYIKVYITEKDVVEVIPLGIYLKGVVAAEMPAEFNLEALKAQSVAARTYALSHIKQYKGIPCIRAKEHEADICDSTHCQVYIGESDMKNIWGENYKKYHEKISEAVKTTEGVVITYNGEPIDSPYYFAASSGFTENSEEVFSEARPYLTSVQSYGDSDAPKFSSTMKINKIDFIKKIKDNYKGATLYKNSLMDQINITQRTDAGNVKQINIGNISLKGTEFRKLFLLNSADFILSDEGEDLIVYCQGYGHEVGMSQWGANGMAKIGKKFDQILKHYYSGTEIRKIF